ncbi:MAG TPA: hypothetical protein PK855_02975 [Bacteroidales bacterium]|nr:hypothetical protein [Bacteroidales bacterium]
MATKTTKRTTTARKPVAKKTVSQNKVAKVLNSHAFEQSKAISGFFSEQHPAWRQIGRLQPVAKIIKLNQFKINIVRHD